jgi:hypothetical protein
VAESCHARSDVERYVYGIIGHREMCGMSRVQRYVHVHFGHGESC